MGVPCGRTLSLGCLSSGSKALVWMKSEDPDDLRIIYDFKTGQKDTLSRVRGGGHRAPRSAQAWTGVLL